MILNQLYITGWLKKIRNTREWERDMMRNNLQPHLYPVIISCQTLIMSPVYPVPVPYPPSIVIYFISHVTSFYIESYLSFVIISITVCILALYNEHVHVFNNLDNFLQLCDEIRNKISFKISINHSWNYVKKASLMRRIYIYFYLIHLIVPLKLITVLLM